MSFGGEAPAVALAVEEDDGILVVVGDAVFEGLGGGADHDFGAGGDFSSKGLGASEERAFLGVEDAEVDRSYVGQREQRTETEECPSPPRAAREQPIAAQTHGQRREGQCVNVVLNAPIDCCVAGDNSAVEKQCSRSKKEDKESFFPGYPQSEESEKGAGTGKHPMDLQRGNRAVEGDVEKGL